ncbi:MAG: hypothetical protein AB1486_03150 [Planctomycetota bacterium]
MSGSKKAAKKRPGERMEVTMPREPVTIDRDKLRAAIRKLGHDYVFYMLDDAIDLLPPAKLHKLAKKYLDLKSLRPDSDKGTKTTLLADVQAFEKASRAGEYYEDFMVNWKNCTDQSTGTTAWIAECHRLLERCVAEQKKGDPVEVRASFDILFGLLDYIDECNDDVIFFADEGGSWQVGVEWDRVLPAWFKVLSATAAPEEYAERITTLLERHHDYGRDKMLAAARKIATPQQRKALAGGATRQARRRR